MSGKLRFQTLYLIRSINVFMHNPVYLDNKNIWKDKVLVRFFFIMLTAGPDTPNYSLLTPNL